MIHKKLLAAHRLHKVPSPFSWLDQRLIRQAKLGECDPPAWALLQRTVFHGPRGVVGAARKRTKSYTKREKLSKCLKPLSPTRVMTLGVTRARVDHLKLIVAPAGGFVDLDREASLLDHLRPSGGSINSQPNWAELCGNFNKLQK